MEDKKSTFRLERLQELIDQSGKTRQELANLLGCDNSTITKHYKGDRSVTTEYLVKYARHFGVSADYLLGLSDTKTSDTTLRSVCDYTGLSEEVVETLSKYRGNLLFALTLSRLINSGFFPLVKKYIMLSDLAEERKGSKEKCSD